MTDVTFLSDWQDSPPPDPTRVLVFEVDVPDAFSTIAIGRGLRQEDGALIRFASDWRPMLDVARAIRDTGHPVECEVPSWAILGVTHPEDGAA